jgi:hypothetical protein
MNKRILLLLICILTFGMVHAVSLSQTTEIPDTLYIGTPFYIHLILPSEADSLHVIIPDSLANFQILEQKSLTEQGKKEFIIKAAAFETGNLQFPSLTVTVFSKVKMDSTTITPFKLTVRSVLPPKEEPKLKDIAGPLNITWTIWNYVVIILAIIIIAGVIYLVIRYLRKRRKTVLNVGKPIELLPAWQVALEQLEALQALRLLDKGDFLNYHFGLSMILRSFLENLVEFNAVEMTTSEIHDILDEREFDRRIGIIEFLQNTDTVKFAKHLPTQEQSDSAYKWLYSYLKSFSVIENKSELENSDA